MQLKALNLYAEIEEYLDFNDETKSLHSAFKEIVEELNTKTLIDIGCGQGAFLQSLNNLNIESLGIDLSPTQIEICNINNINAKCIDLCKVDNKFDCATAIFDVVNYIPKKNIRKFFECVKKVLNINGYFIFDVNTLYGFEEVAQGVLNIDTDNKFIAIDATYEKKILETSITVFNQKGDIYKKEKESIRQFYYSKDFLIKELKLSSFDVESVLEFKLHDVDEYDKQIFICKAT